jgi:hypothetical protein
MVFFSTTQNNLNATSQRTINREMILKKRKGEAISFQTIPTYNSYERYLPKS